MEPINYIGTTPQQEAAWQREKEAHYRKWRAGLVRELVEEITAEPSKQKRREKMAYIRKHYPKIAPDVRNEVVKIFNIRKTRRALS